MNVTVRDWGVTFLDKSGSKIMGFSRYSCLPDTVDPRQTEMGGVMPEWLRAFRPVISQNLSPT